MAHRSTLALLLLAATLHAQAHAQPLLIATDADLIFAGESAGVLFGNAITSIDDINEDGHADLAIGAFLNTSLDPITQLREGGRVSVFTSDTGLFISNFAGNANACFGFALASRDGRIAVGAPCVGGAVESTGGAFLFSPLGNLLAVFTPPFPARFELLGTSISFIDDLTQDSIPDVIVGGYATDIADNGSGRVHIYNGASGFRLQTLTGDNEGDNFGISVSPLEDITGDGVPEIIVGASGNDAASNNAGKAYIFSGADQTSLFPAHLEGQNTLAGFGRSVAALGDLNNDTISDFAVAAPGDNTVTIHSGADASVLSTITTDLPGNFGWVIINAGDADGDGFDDIAVSAPEAADNLGVVTVISTATSEIIYTVLGETENSCFGCSLARIPDTNDDGRPELFIGAPHWNADTGRAYFFHAPSPPCFGDINADGVINATDLARVLSSWNTNNPEVDFNADGIINLRDLSDLLGSWGPCA